LKISYENNLKMKEIIGISLYLSFGSEFAKFFPKNYEKIIKEMTASLFFMNSNWLVKKIVMFLVGFIDKRAAHVMKNIRHYTIKDLDELYIEKIKMMKDLNNMIDDMKLDAFICPGFPLPAYLNKECVPLGFQMEYYNIPNFL